MLSCLARSSAVLAALVLLIGTGVLAGCASEQDRAPAVRSEMAGDQEADVPFVETPQPIVDKMLQLAEVTDRDTVYDLGSGDGRIPITAARTYGAHGVGVEINPDLVEEARKNAREAGVSDLVDFREGDLFEADISEATVVTLYLLPNVNMELRPKLFRELSPGTRVVSHDFDMEHWRPDTTWTSGDRTVYRWTVPETPPPFIEGQ